MILVPVVVSTGESLMCPRPSGSPLTSIPQEDGQRSIGRVDRQDSRKDDKGHEWVYTTFSSLDLFWVSFHYFGLLPRPVDTPANVRSYAVRTSSCTSCSRLRDEVCGIRPSTDTGGDSIYDSDVAYSLLLLRLQ